MDCAAVAEPVKAMTPVALLMRSALAAVLEPVKTVVPPFVRSALAALAPALTSAREGLADGLVAAGVCAKADTMAACARGIANSVSIFFILGIQS